MAGSFGTKRCDCCPAGLNCCGDGTRVAAVDNAYLPQSPNCIGIVMFGNDGYDLAGGAAGTTPDGVGITITGTTASATIGGGGGFSLDMGAEDDTVLYGTNDGPITVSFTVPDGKRLCGVVFGVGHGSFGTLTTYAASVTDTGGTTSASGLSGLTAAFSDCDLTNSAFSAFAAAGESITSVSFEHGGNPGDDFIFIGYISLCLVDA